jgi:inosine-uridine nucleoside N-ribohydrolase
MKPEIINKIVIVWLGGNGLHWPHNQEFNLMQDVAAGRIVFGAANAGVPALVQLPCMGVVSEFRTTGSELEYWLRGKNKLCDYLINHTEEAAVHDSKISTWSRIIWDVCTIGWLLNADGSLMEDRFERAPVPEYDNRWGTNPEGHIYRYVYHIERDALFERLFKTLGE